MRVVAKIGTSSITDEAGAIDIAAIERFCREVAAVRDLGHQVVIVTSAAISAGVGAMGMERRPRDPVTLQALAAVGQSRLMRVYDDVLDGCGLIGGQVLVAPLDFFERQQYLHARGTLERLLELGVVPIVNENDAVADDAIRFGDNDRISALVAHLVKADLLVLLTDTEGLLTADPRRDSSASLIEEIVEIDHELESVAGAAGSVRGSGGMASKLSAAKIAAWSGVRVVIAAARRDHVLTHAVNATPGIGTVVHPRPNRLPAKKLWIAFALPAVGVVTVDDGARRALLERGTSLLPVGVTASVGTFSAGDAVEVADSAGRVFAKGLVQVGSLELAQMAGRKTTQLTEGAPDELIHRDDLVLVP